MNEAIMQTLVTVMIRIIRIGLMFVFLLTIRSIIAENGFLLNEWVIDKTLSCADVARLNLSIIYSEASFRHKALPAQMTG